MIIILLGDGVEKIIIPAGDNNLFCGELVVGTVFFWRNWDLIIARRKYNVGVEKEEDYALKQDKRITLLKERLLSKTYGTAKRIAGMEQTVIQKTQLGVAGQARPEIYDADTSGRAGLVASPERVEAATPRRAERIRVSRTYETELHRSTVFALLTLLREAVVLVAVRMTGINIEADVSSRLNQFLSRTELPGLDELFPVRLWLEKEPSWS